MAEHQLPKLNTGVRFPSPAPKTASIKGYLPFLYFFAFYSRLAFLSSTRRPLTSLFAVHFSLFAQFASLAEEGEPRQGKPEGFCGVIWNLNKKQITF